MNTPIGNENPYNILHVVSSIIKLRSIVDFIETWDEQAKF